MKTVIAVRHAKSSWDSIAQKDFDRPLNDRGKRDAPEMAERLVEKGLTIDLLVSSPAKRALKTARLFAEVLKYDKDKIREAPELYEAPPEAFYQVLATLSAKHDTVLMFAHNPGITGFVNSLTDVHIDDMPTCAMFAVQVETADWSAFHDSNKKFLFFDYPKNPLGQYD